MLNVNVGILGHVDSGKTALAKALSSIGSTSSFDRSAISQRRGITIDLGFSACYLSTEEEEKTNTEDPKEEDESLQNEPASLYDNSDSGYTNKMGERNQTEWIEKIYESAKGSSLYSLVRTPSLNPPPVAPTKEEEEEKKDVSIKTIQLTLVDCPGHSSLIRTVVGGAHIINIALLVIDATKGIQAQTSECIVLAQVLRKPILVVLNKVDRLVQLYGKTKGAAEERVRKMKIKLREVFERHTCWPLVDIVCVSAAPGRSDAEGVGEKETDAEKPPGGTNDPFSPPPHHVKDIFPPLLRLIDALLEEEKEQNQRGTTSNNGLQTARLSNKKEGEEEEMFLMAVDHCFALKGKGTIFTGTVLQGRLSVGDRIFIPEVDGVHATSQPSERKVKSLQCFKKSVDTVNKNDRVGLCVGQFDPELVERGIICGVPSSSSGVTGSKKGFVSSEVWLARIHRVKQYKLIISSVNNSHNRFHVCIGHTTAMASFRFFYKESNDNGEGEEGPSPLYDLKEEAQYMDTLDDEDAYFHYQPHPSASSSSKRRGIPLPLSHHSRKQFYAVLLFDKPILVYRDSTRATPSQVHDNPFIAMRLDIPNSKEQQCRIAMGGNILLPLSSKKQPDGTSAPSTAAAMLTGLNSSRPYWRDLPVVKYKYKELRVERVLSTTACIAGGIITDHTNGNDGTSTAATAGPVKKKGAVKHSEVQKFIGLTVLFVPPLKATTTTGVESVPSTTVLAHGTIDSSFGQSGKVKLVFTSPIFCEKGPLKKENQQEESGTPEGPFTTPGTIVLKLKKFPLAEHSALTQ